MTATDRGIAKRSLSQLFNAHCGKATDKWEQYISAYEAELDVFVDRGTAVQLLEIGVQNGGSLELWHSYLPEGSTCVGLDIDERVAALAYDSEEISVRICDAADVVELERVVGDRTFDIIIDDGSHLCKDVITTFQFLFQRLAPGGKYFIEDLHCSYYGNFGGGLREPSSSIEFLKCLIDALHFDYIRVDHIADDKTWGTFQAYNRWIARITFYDSLCVLEKTSFEKDQPYRRALGGVDEQLVPTSKLLQQGQLGRRVLLSDTILHQVNEALLAEVENVRAHSAALAADLDRIKQEKEEVERILMKHET